MAQRRMIAIKVVDSDLFLDMPTSTRLLYYDLSIRADDDGFVSSPRKILKMVGCSDDDLKILIVKQFIIPFDSGVCVIKHWKIHNYIQSDRYQSTIYLEEKAYLSAKEGIYQKMDTKCIQTVSIVDTQVRLGKVRLGKVNTTKTVVKKELKQVFGEYKNVRLTTEEYERLKVKRQDIDLIIEWFSSYIEEKRYKSENHNLAIQRWVINAVDKDTASQRQKPTLFGCDPKKTTGGGFQM